VLRWLPNHWDAVELPGLQDTALQVVGVGGSHLDCVEGCAAEGNVNLCLSTIGCQDLHLPHTTQQQSQAQLQYLLQCSAEQGTWCDCTASVMLHGSFQSPELACVAMQLRQTL
jgi:hypothetical protein